MGNLVFITGNQNKADILQRGLGLPVEHHKLDLEEIQSLDLKAVAEHKARQAFDILGQPVLIEDASLTFTAMGRLPGTFVKWFIEELGIPGLAKLAASLPSQEAVARVLYAYCDGESVQFFEGTMKGKIIGAPRGDNGFGFDPIFINDDYNVTRAEMAVEDYDATSYRTLAMKPLREYLRDIRG
ncbi:MAG TPA: non-canonical purine NTP pyrophosphatase [Candidatus Saccharimonadales bacterium]|nr:non-canonical purine NTP pyrophosphatase [Candidatus Saccharimonadales bacterium]